MTRCEVRGEQNRIGTMEHLIKKMFFFYGYRNSGDHLGVILYIKGDNRCPNNDIGPCSIGELVFLSRLNFVLLNPDLSFMKSQ